MRGNANGLSQKHASGLGRKNLQPASQRRARLCRVPDTITNSKIANLKELRPGSRGRSEIRILFVFDPWRSAILLVAGDKAGNWTKWYARMIPRAEQLYEIYLKERGAEEGSQ